MKNKKMIFGTIIFLFAITGICSIQNASAFTDTVTIPPLSYAWYHIGYLESGDEILINEIDSDGGIDVFIMNGNQFDELQNNLYFHYEKKWNDITLLMGWTFEISGSGNNYYVVLENEALLTGRTVYVDLSIRYYEPIAIDNPMKNTFWIWLLIIILTIIGVIGIPIILVRKYKKKTPREVIVVQEKEIPKIIYCSECGAEISNKERKFCSKCGSKIIN